MTEFLTILASGLFALLVTWATIRAEESRGRALLYSLCSRYFIAVFNTVDPDTNQIKNSGLERAQFQAELEAILDDLSKLTSNPLFIRLIARHERIGHFYVQLRREVVERRGQAEIAHNLGTLGHFIEMYDWCLEFPWGFSLRKHERTRELVSWFRKWLTNAST